jgi:hypothetical protein
MFQVFYQRGGDSFPSIDGQNAPVVMEAHDQIDEGCIPIGISRELQIEIDIA